MSRPKLDPFPGAVPIAVFVLPWRGRLRGGRCSRAIRDVPSRIRGHGDLGFHPISGMQSQKGANSRRRASLIRGRVAAQQAGRGLTETPDGVPPPGEPGDPTRTRRFPSRSTAGAATGEPSRPAPSIPSSRGGADRARPVQWPVPFAGPAPGVPSSGVGQSRAVQFPDSDRPESAEATARIPSTKSSDKDAARRCRGEVRGWRSMSVEGSGGAELAAPGIIDGNPRALGKLWRSDPRRRGLTRSGELGGGGSPVYRWVRTPDK